MAANTVTEEISRQSRRVSEQYNQLHKMLNTVISNISGTREIMENRAIGVSFDPNLVDQLKKLSTALADYDKIASGVYKGLSANLETYSKRLSSNLDNLSSNIGKLINSINGLK